MQNPALLLVLAITLSMTACKDERSKNKASGDVASESTDTKTSAKKPKRNKKEKKDRGDASMKIADFDWKADGASAKIKEKQLTIRSSHTEVKEGKASRQELQLLIKDYAGPGEYTTGISGSRFIGVGLDTSAAKSAGGDSDAVTKEAINSLANAKHLMLANAKVKIDSESDSEISGSFSWTPPKGSKQPALSGGTFRAVLK